MKKNLIILIPTGGKVHTAFMKCMIGLTQALGRRGIAFGVKTYEFSDLVMSRNYLVSYFLSQEKHTHALLLDSDLEFSPEQVFRLFDFEEDFVAATYPDRRVTGPVLRDALMNCDPDTLKDQNAVRALLAKHMRYIATQNLGANKKFNVQKRDGFRTVASVGTGFMLITRNVVEQIVENGQARPLPRSGRLNIYQDAPRFSDFFSHHLTDQGDAFYGEDQSFCRRWILGCGGDIWVDDNSQVNHIGEFSYFGDFGAHLEATGKL